MMTELEELRQIEITRIKQDLRDEPARSKICAIQQQPYFSRHGNLYSAPDVENWVNKVAKEHEKSKVHPDKNEKNDKEKINAKLLGDLIKLY